MTNQNVIYLAGGCFWGIEAYFSRLGGVVNTQVGYANGKTQNPTYEEVCTCETDFVETVKISYDSTKIGLEEILDNFFEIIDPTTMNKQAGDVETQYRSGIYYTNPEDKDKIQTKIAGLQENYAAKIVTEVLPLKNFYKAEDYHQKYLDKNPSGYCHINLSKLNKE